MDKFFYKSPIKFSLLPLKKNLKGGVFLVFDGSLKSLENSQGFTYLTREEKRTLLSALRNLTPLKLFEYKSFYFPSGKEVVVLAKDKKFNLRKLRLLIRKIYQIAKNEKIKNLFVFLKDLALKEHNQETIIREIAINFLMADLNFGELYKSPPKEGWFRPENLGILVSARLVQSLKPALREGIIIGEEVNNCRLWSNLPGGEITPAVFTKIAKHLSNLSGFKLKILDQKQLQKLNAQGILSVAKGSRQEPFLLILELGKKQKQLAIVGKGLTFDTGGLALKPWENMKDMFMDVSGGSAVLAVFSALARMKKDISLVGAIPLAENMPSGESLRPGDVIKMMNNKTVEVGTPDAEGRLILADGIVYLKKNYKPKMIVTIATLTGSALYALGERATAIFTNQQEKVMEFQQLGEQAGDYVWPLPLWEEYRKDIDSTIADIYNIGKNKFGGAIHGAMFLWEFAKPSNFLHLDIAPRMVSLDDEFLSKGASGVGVRYLIELAQNLAK